MEGERDREEGREGGREERGNTYPFRSQAAAKLSIALLLVYTCMCTHAHAVCGGYVLTI